MAWWGQNSLHLKQQQQTWLFTGYTDPSSFPNTPMEHISIQTQLFPQRFRVDIYLNLEGCRQADFHGRSRSRPGMRPKETEVVRITAAGVYTTSRRRQSPVYEFLIPNAHINFGTLLRSRSFPFFFELPKNETCRNDYVNSRGSGSRMVNCMKTMILIFLVIGAAVISGCAQQPAQPVPQTTVQTTAAPPADTIRTAASPLGTILVDARGMTLYYFANDIPASGASTCYGPCAVAWPVFSADTVKVSAPLDAADFGSITRTDGTKQTTWKGWPLYYWQADTKAGDVSGENVQNVWFVLNLDERVLIAHSPATGMYLTDTVGKTLYYFTADTPGTSACTGACLARWPAFSADPVRAPSVLKPADFSAVVRADGVRQTAFMGRPLYYFADDMKPGDLKGQGFNGVWYVANISGSAPAATPTTLKTLSPTGGGSGY